MNQLNTNEEENELKQVIMIVDDSPDNITLIRNLLKDHYRIKVATNGEKALSMIEKGPPDIILLDVEMPVMDGYETCRRLKREEQWRDIPVIFLTSKNEVADESKGLDLGAADYITKPVNPVILLSRVKTHLSLKMAGDFLKYKNQYLEEEVSRRTKEIAVIQEISIMAMATLAEMRDSETGNHLQRTKLFVKELCHSLCQLPAYEKELTPKAVNMIVASAPLHDIGKIGIPDSILLKPGKLTKEEFEIMKTHTTLGKEAILKAEQSISWKNTFMCYPKEMVYSHHEQWDGSGYPIGLSEENIPLSARIIALADVYDALTSKRVYKPAFSHEKAIAIIQAEAGKHFDPAIVQIFLSIHEKFHEIAKLYWNN